MDINIYSELDEGMNLSVVDEMSYVWSMNTRLMAPLSFPF